MTGGVYFSQNIYLFLRFVLIFYSSLSLCVVCVCVNVCCVCPSACEGEKRMSGSLAVELQFGCELPKWMLGPELEYFGRSESPPHLQCQKTVFKWRSRL